MSYLMGHTASANFIHLACFDCGAVEELAEPVSRLKNEMLRAHGFHVRTARLEIKGRCRACRDRLDKRPREEETLLN